MCMPQQTPTPMIDRSQVEQNRYLDYCLKHKVEISIILISGTHFIGFVLDHDRKGLLLGGKREDKPARYISQLPACYATDQPSPSSLRVSPSSHRCKPGLHP